MDRIVISFAYPSSLITIQSASLHLFIRWNFNFLGSIYDRAKLKFLFSYFYL